MARKVKKLPEDIVLIHYSKNGKVVSDLCLGGWYEDIVKVVLATRRIKKSLIIKVGTENMVHMTRNLVKNKVIRVDKIRYKYGRRVFRIDAAGFFVGTPGKQIPPNFLEVTDKIKDPLLRDSVHRQFKKNRPSTKVFDSFAHLKEKPSTINPHIVGTTDYYEWEMNNNKIYQPQVDANMEAIHNDGLAGPKITKGPWLQPYEHTWGAGLKKTSKKVTGSVKSFESVVNTLNTYVNVKPLNSSGYAYYDDEDEEE